MYGDDSTPFNQGTDSGVWQAIIHVCFHKLGVPPVSLNGFLNTPSFFVNPSSSAYFSEHLRFNSSGFMCNSLAKFKPKILSLSASLIRA